VEFDARSNVYFFEQTANTCCRMLPMSYSASGVQRWKDPPVLESFQTPALTTLGHDGRLYALATFIPDRQMHLLAFDTESGDLVYDEQAGEFFTGLFPYSRGLILSGIGEVQYRGYDGGVENVYSPAPNTSNQLGFIFALGGAGTVLGLTYVDECSTYSGTWPNTQSVSRVRVVRITPKRGVVVDRLLARQYLCGHGAIAASPSVGSDGDGAMLRLITKGLDVELVGIDRSGSELWRSPLLYEDRHFESLSPLYVDSHGMGSFSINSRSLDPGDDRWRVDLVSVDGTVDIVGRIESPNGSVGGTVVPAQNRVYFGGATPECGTNCLIALDWPGLGEDYVRALMRGEAIPTPSDPPVIFVHGIDIFGRKAGEPSAWGPMKAAFRRWGWTGKLKTIGYYQKDSGFDATIGEFGRDTSISVIANRWAWYVWEHFSHEGVSIKAVGHSMGGLIIRYALARVQEGHRDYPKSLLVDEVVTLGTPHGGTKMSRGCYYVVVQCSEMTPGSDFIEELKRSANNPQASGGTEWTIMGSYKDLSLNPDETAVNNDMDAAHRVMYDEGMSVGHSDYYGEVRNVSDSKVEYLDAASGWRRDDATECSQSPWPVRWSFLTLSSSGSVAPCG
jgi:pimeloyl-ACP methyl ester carboxylesterase